MKFWTECVFFYFVVITVLGFNIDERFPNQCGFVNGIMQFLDDSVISAGYCDRGLVALNFADIIELRNFVADFHIPFLDDNIPYTLPNVRQFERNNTTQNAGVVQISRAHLQI